MVNTRTGGGQDAPPQRRANSISGRITGARARSASPTARRQRRRSAPGRPHTRPATRAGRAAPTADAAHTETTLQSSSATQAETQIPEQSAPRQLAPNPYGNWDEASAPDYYVMPTYAGRVHYTQHQPPRPPATIQQTPWTWLYSNTTPAPTYSQPPMTSGAHYYPPASVVHYMPPPATTTTATSVASHAHQHSDWQQPAALQEPAQLYPPAPELPVPEHPAAPREGEHELQFLNEQWQSPLSHITKPLSQSVSPSVKQKILNHQFIDIATLISKPTANKRMKLEVDPAGGYLVCATPSESRTFLSIEKWTSAFILFSAVYLEHYLPTHPHKALELLQYMDTIRYAASTYPGRGWAIYDEQTRKTWSSPAVPFHQMQGDFWLKFISTPPAFNPATNAGKICFDFNKGSCNRTSCIFKHACSACGSLRHPASARACNQNSNNRNNQFGNPRYPTQPFRPRFPPRQNPPKPFTPHNTPR